MDEELLENLKQREHYGTIDFMVEPSEDDTDFTRRITMVRFEEAIDMSYKSNWRVVSDGRFYNEGDLIEVDSNHSLFEDSDMGLEEGMIRACVEGDEFLEDFIENPSKSLMRTCYPDIEEVIDVFRTEDVRLRFNNQNLDDIVF